MTRPRALLAAVAALGALALLASVLLMALTT